MTDNDTGNSAHRSVRPCVSIGLPVYNGARFLKQSIESILAQTFRDFELIISDNGSTDETESICRAYASGDNRIRYFRNAKNLGAAKNYNRVVELARGGYFRWVASDDVIAPACLAKCVAVLDANTDILLCHTGVRLIDRVGKHLGNHEERLHFVSGEPHVRFCNYLSQPIRMWNAIYGLVRTEQLRNTPLIRPFMGSDQVLLGELVLKGKIYQISEHLFLRRQHPGQACGAYQAGPAKKALIGEWFDPANSGKRTLPEYVHHFVAYLGIVSRAPMGLREKLRAYNCAISWALQRFPLIRRFAKTRDSGKRRTG